MADRINLKDLKHGSMINMQSFLDLSQFVQSTPRQSTSTQKISTGNLLSPKTTNTSQVSLRAPGSSLKQKARRKSHRLFSGKPTEVLSEVIGKIFIVGKDESPEYLITNCFPKQPKPTQGGYKLNVWVFLFLEFFHFLNLMIF